jgi:hypothetical protein
VVPERQPGSQPHPQHGGACFSIGSVNVHAHHEADGGCIVRTQRCNDSRQRQIRFIRILGARGWRHYLRKIVECNGNLAARLRRRTLRAIHSVRDRHYPRLQECHATY